MYIYMLHYCNTLLCNNTSKQGTWISVKLLWEGNGDGPDTLLDIWILDGPR